MVTEDWIYERKMDGYLMNSSILGANQYLLSPPDKFILYSRSVFPFKFPLCFVFFANYVLTKDK